MKRSSLSALVLLCFAGAASAQTIDVRFVGSGAGESITVTSPSVNGGLFAGQLRHELSNPLGGTPVDMAGTRNTYCIDLGQYVATNTTTYAYLDTNAPSIFTGNAAIDARLTAISWLFSRDGAAASSTSDNAVAAGMQVALWEVITDWDPNVGRASLDLGSGAFMAGASPAVLAQANAFLDNAIPGLGLPADVAILADGVFQDQITLVPTPGAALVAGTGILWMMGRRRRSAQ